jgi:hypothetical protein
VSRGPFRALHFDGDATEDAHGISVGDNWPLITLPAWDDTGTCHVTTNHVHASEVGDLVPGTNRGTARLIAVALNEAFARRTWAEWAVLLAEVERGEPPPPPRELETCTACGEKIGKGCHSRSTPHGWEHFHSGCYPWDPKMPF